MRTEFGDLAVEATFARYPPKVRVALLKVRELILTTGLENPATGGLIETLKWGQPSYLPRNARVGTTVRLDVVRGASPNYAVFFHCKTSLVSTFRELYRDELSFEGNRAIVFSTGKTLPRDLLKHCISLALTYHLRKAELAQPLRSMAT